MTAGLDLATAGATWIRLAVGPPPPGAPWTAARAVDALSSVGASLNGRPDVLGAGRGEPLLTRHELDWRGIPLHLGYHRYRDGTGEVALELPPWDELRSSGVLAGGALWELVDAVAAAIDATHGGIGDEDALIAPAPGDAGRRLAAEIVPAGSCAGRGGWVPYRTLPLSGLLLMVRP